MSDPTSQSDIEKLLAEANFAQQPEASAPIPQPPPAPVQAKNDQATGSHVFGKWLRLQALPANKPGSVWLCRHEESGTEAWMYASTREDSNDMRSWERLCALKVPSLQRPLDLVVVGGRRWEIFESPKGVKLCDEVKAIGRACPALIITLLKDLAEAVEALHAAKLVHLHISPETIFVEKQAETYRLVVGGLETLSCLDESKPIQFEIDPFCAPPEAAGSLKHDPGPGLKAWDWWTVGRVLQELVLGRHVIEYILDHPLNRASPEDKVFAEELLLEKFNAETRAGAVESMPPMDKRIDLLMHGLLTGCRDARWGSDEVKGWLSGEEPKERYKLPRKERLFIYKSKAYTILEAVEKLGEAENWDDAAKQLLDKKSPFTLATFLVEQPDLRPYAAKLDDALALGMSVDLRNYPPVVKNEIVLAIALMKVGGGRLVWRGRRVDAACLREMLADVKATPNRLACVQAFCSTSVLLPLEVGDAEAFRTLSDGAKLAAKAVNLATQNEWLVPAGPQAVPSLWRLSWESSAALASARKQLQDSYAFSDRKEVQALFESQTPSPEGALLLAWMLPIADRLGFVTHEVWEQRQHKILADRGACLAGGLFWLRLRSTLHIGLPWFGSFPAVIILGLMAGATIALAWPGPEYLPGALIPLILAVCARIGMTWVIPHLIAQQFPKKRWGLFDGTGRCKREYAELLPTRPSRRAIRRELAEINDTIVRFSRDHSESERIPAPPAFQDLRMLGVVAWLFLLVPVIFAVIDLRKTSDPIARLEYAWTPEEERHLEWLPPEPEVKVAFPYTQPDSPRMLAVIASEPATRLQKKMALRRGIYLARDYKPEEINACILVKMPHVRNHAFMIYDPVEREVVGDEIIFLQLTPNRRTWAKIDNRVVFLPDY